MENTHSASRTHRTRQDACAFPRRPLAVVRARFRFATRVRCRHVLACLLLAIPGIVSATSTTRGLTVTCNTNPPDPCAQHIGNGPNCASETIVSIDPDAGVPAGNSTHGGAPSSARVEACARP